MKRAFFALACIVPFLFGPIACHSQPSPTKGYNISWTWTAPTTGSCTANCSYIVSTLSVPSGTASCPAPTGQYNPQQTSSTALSGTSWLQTNTTGLTYCAVVSSVFNSATSAASAVSNVVTSPALPTAPGVPSGGNVQQSEVIKPDSVADPQPQLSAKLEAPGGMRGVVRRR